MRILSYLVSLILGAFLFMIAVGVIHHEWLTNMPTIGFRGSLIVTVLLGLIGFPLVAGSWFDNVYGRGREAMTNRNNDRRY